MFSQVIRSFTSQFPAYVLHVQCERCSRCAQRSESLLFPSILAPRFPRVAPPAAIQTRARHLFLFLFFFFFPRNRWSQFFFQSSQTTPCPPPKKKKKNGNQAHPESVFYAYVLFVSDSPALSSDVVAPPTFLTAMT